MLLQAAFSSSLVIEKGKMNTHVLIQNGCYKSDILIGGTCTTSIFVKGLNS